ncbi:hypothetical protein HYW74_01990 [Candidatus Pacearchaeota archaeon]|nr:hypothetical protein [Candidatus Pacearchaeota archaeon]
MKKDYEIPGNSLSNTDYDLIQDTIEKKSKGNYRTLASKITGFLEVIQEVKRVSDEIYYLRVTI